MKAKRRTILKGSLASSAVAVAVGAGLIHPRQVLAAWPTPAFEAKSVSDALKSLLGADAADASGGIEIKAPDIAENGAVVPVTVTSTLNKVESISIVAEKNGTPLVATFNLTEAANPYVSTRIKMGQTSNVVAVVKADGKLYRAQKEVKVTIGGCGG